MARLLYGATGADYLVDPATNLPEDLTSFDLYDAETAGTQVTDLLDVDDNAITQVTTDAHGFFRFQGPDGVTDALWIETGLGFRIATRPVNPPDFSGTVPPDLSDPSDTTKVDPTKITTASVMVAIGDATTGAVPTSGRVQVPAGKARAIGRVIAQLDGPALAQDLDVTAVWRERATGTRHTQLLTLTQDTDLIASSTVTWAVGKLDDLAVEWSGGAFAGVNLLVIFDGGDTTIPTAIAAPANAPTCDVSGGVVTITPGGGDVAYRAMLTTGTTVETLLAVVEDTLTYDITGVTAGEQINVRVMNRDGAGPATSFSTYLYDYTFDTAGAPDSSLLGIQAPTNTTNTAGTGIAPEIVVASGKLHCDSGTVGAFAAGDTAWFWPIDPATTSPLSIDNFDLLIDFVFTTSGEIDLYFRGVSSIITDADTSSALTASHDRMQLALFTNGYKLSEKISSTTTYLLGSSGTAVSWAGGNLALGTVYRLRLTANGATVVAKVWDASTSEPGTNEFSNGSAGITAAGVILVECVGPSTANTQRSYQFDNFSVAAA